MVESNSTSFETLAFQANAVNWVAGEPIPSLDACCKFLTWAPYLYRRVHGVAACMTTLLYNHLITFDQEVVAIWTARWTLSKFLYILMKYSAFAQVAIILWSASFFTYPQMSDSIE